MDQKKGEAMASPFSVCDRCNFSLYKTSIRKDTGLKPDPWDWMKRLLFINLVFDIGIVWTDVWIHLIDIHIELLSKKLFG